jgi:broad specificity phosphatase PhoE
MTKIGWPQALWFVRHGESVGNVANDAARRAKALRLDIETNDIDVPLTDVGVRQATALGEWLGEVPAAEQPTCVAVSPYSRARDTARLIVEAAGFQDLPVVIDERLRDREQGVLDRLTGAGFRDQYPEEAKRREYVGKFWFRPSGGESWADVALRIRAALLEFRLTMPDERVLIVTHDVPILVARYILEELTAGEATALSGQLRNCSVTRYAARPDGLGMVLEDFNDVTAIERDEQTPVTAHG